MHRGLVAVGEYRSMRLTTPGRNLVWRAHARAVTGRPGAATAWKNSRSNGSHTTSGARVDSTK